MESAYFVSKVKNRIQNELVDIMGLDAEWYNKLSGYMDVYFKGFYSERDMNSVSKGNILMYLKNRMLVDIYYAKRKIYFGGRSRRWNGAVAFLDLDSIGIAFGRIYLIKKTQLDEIQIMEGNSYTERVLLEFIDDVPVYTFTSPSRRNVRTMPSKEYLETIETGLRDLHNKADVAVQHYLYSRGFLT